MATKGVQHEGGVSGVGAVAQTVGIKGINEAENRITDVNIKTLETVIALRRIRDAAVELQVDLKGVNRAM